MSISALPTSSPIAGLPAEIWGYIMFFLDLSTVFALSQTCRALHTIGRNPLLHERIIPDPKHLYNEGKWDEFLFWLRSVDGRLTRLSEMKSRFTTLVEGVSVIETLKAARDGLTDICAISAMDGVITAKEAKLETNKKTLHVIKSQRKVLKANRKQVCKLFESVPRGWKKNRSAFPRISQTVWKTCTDIAQPFYGYGGAILKGWRENAKLTWMMMQGEPVQTLALVFALNRRSAYRTIIDVDPDWSDDVWRKALSNAPVRHVCKTRIHPSEVGDSLAYIKGTRSCPNVCGVMMRVLGKPTSESLDLFGVQENMRFERITRISFIDLLLKRGKIDELSYAIENSDDALDRIGYNASFSLLWQLSPSLAKIKVLLKSPKVLVSSPKTTAVFCDTVETVGISWSEMFEMFPTVQERLAICHCAHDKIPLETIKTFVFNQASVPVVISALKIVIAIDGFDPIDFLAKQILSGKEYSEVLDCVDPRHFQRIMTRALLEGNRWCVKGLIRHKYFPSQQDRETIKTLGTRDRKVFSELFEECQKRILF